MVRNIITEDTKTGNEVSGDTKTGNEVTKDTKTAGNEFKKVANKVAFITIIQNVLLSVLAVIWISLIFYIKKIIRKKIVQL